MKYFLSKMLSAFVILVLVLFGNIEAQQTKVKGKLLDANGKPSKEALVGIMGEITVAKNFVKCDEKGNYSVTLTKPGVNRILFSIPDHNAEKVLVVNSSDKEVNVDVKLDYYKYKDTLNEVSVMGDFNNYDFNSAEQMKKKEDGTFFLEIKTDKPTVKYQLCKIEANNRTINAPETTKFEEDSTGDYRSIAEAKDGKAVIVFNPAKLKKGEGKAKVVMEGDPFSEALAGEQSEYGALSMNASKLMGEYYQKNKNIEGFEYKDGGKVAELLKKTELEKNPELKDFYKLNYVSFVGYKIKDYDFSKASEYYESVSPQSIVWDIVMGAYISYYQLLPQFKWKTNEEKFLNESKSESIKLNIYRSKLANAKFSSNTEELKRLHELINKNFGELEMAKQMLKQFPVESKIKVGVEIPDYEVVSLDNKNDKLSKKSMLGKIYMIDFWATWCGPCVGEMESLHKAYEKFKDKGFEILSLSSDASEKDVEKFRNGEWKMPWKHGFVSNSEGRKISQAFEVIGIPRPILVSKDGKILAMEGDLRGQNLEQTLAKYFQ
ncbi:MAG: thioredoxin family protein [Stygiobacter sp.]|nr:MAG: thioredoxin family protein [Stygiobacter sp.]KAF0217614.1 MAG: thioredoxin family [Ignavibacteria bacterium]